MRIEERREKKREDERRREKKRERERRREIKGRNREKKRKRRKKREKMSRVYFYLETLFQKYLSTSDLNYYQSAFNSQKRKTKCINRNARNFKKWPLRADL